MRVRVDALCQVPGSFWTFLTKDGRVCPGGLSVQRVSPGPRAAALVRRRWPADSAEAEGVRHAALSRRAARRARGQAGAARGGVAARRRRGEQPQQGDLDVAPGVRRDARRASLHRDGARPRLPVRRERRGGAGRHDRTRRAGTRACPSLHYAGDSETPGDRVAAPSRLRRSCIRRRYHASPSHRRTRADRSGEPCGDRYLVADRSQASAGHPRSRPLLDLVDRSAIHSRLRSRARRTFRATGRALPTRSATGS